MAGRFTALGLALALGLAPGLGHTAATKPTDEVIDAPLSVLQKPEVLDRIGRDIRFVFADAPGPIPPQSRVRSRKTARNSNNPQADCEAALVVTLQSMAIAARKRGATSIVNIRSFWAGYPTSSATTYKCGRGRGVSGVSLVGTLEGAQ